MNQNNQNNQQLELQKNRECWLKNVKNGVIYFTPKNMYPIYLRDRINRGLAVLATEEEVKKWKDGTYWPKPSAPAKTEANTATNSEVEELKAELEELKKLVKGSSKHEKKTNKVKI